MVGYVIVCLNNGVFARNTVQQQTVIADGPKCPIDNPLVFGGPVPLNITLDPVVQISEESQASNLIVEGLSELRYTVSINVITYTAYFEIIIERVTGNATYSASGYIDLSPIPPEIIPSGYFIGEGSGKVSVSAFNLKGRATLFVNELTNKINIRALTLENVSFDSLAIDFGTKFEIGGMKINWNSFNFNIKVNFDRDFSKYRNAITDQILIAANHLIGKYTIDEFIHLINDQECEDG